MTRDHALDELRRDLRAREAECCRQCGDPSPYPICNGCWVGSLPPTVPSYLRPPLVLDSGLVVRGD